MIEVDPTKYEGVEPLHVRVIQHQWEFDPYWLTFALLNPANKVEISLAKEAILTGLELLDIYKDLSFLFWFKHVSIFITYGLAMSLAAPLTFLYLRHDNIKMSVLYFLGIQNMF